MTTGAEQLRPALTALDESWQVDLTDFHAGLAERPVRSPTYAQLFEPIHDRSVGRWQGYAEYLDPQLAKLEPICRQLGY